MKVSNGIVDYGLLLHNTHKKTNVWMVYFSYIF